MADFSINATNIGETPNAVTPKSGVVDNSKATAISGLGDAAVKGLDLYATEKVAGEKTELEGAVRDLLSLDPGSPDEIAFGNTLSKARQVAAIGNVKKAKLMIETKQRELTTKSPWLANRFRRMVNEINADYSATMDILQEQENQMAAQKSKGQTLFEDEKRWIRDAGLRVGIDTSAVMDLQYGVEGSDEQLDRMREFVSHEVAQQHLTEQRQKEADRQWEQQARAMQVGSFNMQVDTYNRTRAKAAEEDLRAAQTNTAYSSATTRVSAAISNFRRIFPTVEEQQQNYALFASELQRDVLQNITLDAKGQPRGLDREDTNAIMQQVKSALDELKNVYTGPLSRGGVAGQQAQEFIDRNRLDWVQNHGPLAYLFTNMPGAAQIPSVQALVSDSLTTKVGNTKQPTPLRNTLAEDVKSLSTGPTIAQPRQETQARVLQGIQAAISGEVPRSPEAEHASTVTAANVLEQATIPGSTVEPDLKENPAPYGNAVIAMSSTIEGIDPVHRERVLRSLISDTFSSTFDRLPSEQKPRVAQSAQKMFSMYIQEHQNKWSNWEYSNGKISVKGNRALPSDLMEVNAANKVLQQLVQTHKVTDPDMTQDEIFQRYFEHEVVGGMDAGD